MNKARLERLITILEGVAAANKAFTLSSWLSSEQEIAELAVYAAEEHDVDSSSVCITSGSFEETCGAAACALGYAALDPQFQSEGLSLTLDALSKTDQTMICNRTIASIADFNAIMIDKGLTGVDVTPKFAGHEGFDAGAAFLGISSEAAEFLFAPWSYENGELRPILPSEVIARVREVIALNGRAPEGFRPSCC